MSRDADHVIRLENIVKRYGSEVVLDDVTIGIAPGEFIVVKGRSGVGKSTLARISALLDAPDSGKVFFMGKDVTRANDRVRSSVRLRHIGYVDQFFKLIPNMTLLENVMLPLKLLGMKTKDAEARALEALKLVGLADLAERYPTKVSGGQRQRTAIARAIAKKPKILVCDEPLSNLDNETAVTIIKLYRKMSREGTAILMTTTDLGLELLPDREYLLIKRRLKLKKERKN